MNHVVAVCHSVLFLVWLLSIAVEASPASPATAERRLREPEWSAILAKRIGGETEYRLPDGSRIDILTDTTAWEVEWCTKWEESIGQSLFYGIVTNRKPGVWLLKRRGDDEDFLRCLLVCRKVGIELRVEDVKP